MFDKPAEPSAFGSHNLDSGPFFDPNVERPSSSKKKPKRRRQINEEAAEWADGHGFMLPLNVGQQAKKKEKARLEKRHREAQYPDDDDDDFFSGLKASGSTRKNGAPSTNGKSNGKRITFGVLAKDQGRFASSSSSKRDGRDRGSRYAVLPEHEDDTLPRPARETDSIQIRGASKRREEQRRSGSGGDSRRYQDRDRYVNEHERSRDRDRDRGKGREREWDREKERDRRYDRERDFGPRYKGGYSR